MVYQKINIDGRCTLVFDPLSVDVKAKDASPTAWYKTHQQITLPCLLRVRGNAKTSRDHVSGIHRK